MSSYYECKRCLFKTIKKSGMVFHVDKKYKCKIVNIFNEKTDEQLKEESLILNHSNIDLSLYKYQCSHCLKPCIDKTIKDIHEVSCLKKKEKFKLSDEDIKKIYQNKQELNKITKNDLSNTVLTFDESIIIVDLESINLVAMIKCFDMSDWTNDERKFSIYNFDLWKFIKKVFENPKNHHILLNDPKKKEVIVFINKEIGFDKLDISQFLIICLENIIKYHEFYIYKTILFNDIDSKEKDILNRKNQIKYLNCKNMIEKNIEKYNEKIYLFLSKIIPSYENKLKELEYYHINRDKLNIYDNFYYTEKKFIEFEYFITELEKKNIIDNINILDLSNHFIDLYTNTKIKCLKHGECEIKPILFIDNYGCFDCTQEREDISGKYSFIERSMKIHTNKSYDYNKVEYINIGTEVDIVCKTHGIFKIKPVHHILDEKGCHLCKMKANISRVSIQWLDFISVFYGICIQHGKNSTEFKIPGTRYRADGYCKDTNTIYEFHGSFWHGDIKYYNKNDINYMTKTTFGLLYEKTKSREEHIKKLGYNLISMWEFDWYKIIRMIKRVQKLYRKKLYSKIKV